MKDLRTEALHYSLALVLGLDMYSGTYTTDYHSTALC
jgi:hypothetical protein